VTNERILGDVLQLGMMLGGEPDEKPLSDGTKALFRSFQRRVEDQLPPTEEEWEAVLMVRERLMERLMKTFTR